MAKVLKRFLVTDRFGRPVLSNSERLTDNGRGRTSLTNRRVAIWCQSCHRPVTDLAELRGKCDYCRLRKCCSRCEAVCAGCSRRLCGYCRRGFVGNRVFTVCPICLVRLRQRQLFQDQILMRKLALHSQILRQRERTRIEALRLQAARARMTGQLQAARLSNHGRLSLIREINKVKLALARLWYNNARHLR
jgi:hypothetical protein